jgi:ABC-type transporter Mla subunit MlaD
MTFTEDWRMSNEKLRTAVEEIRATLARGEGLSADARRSLEELANDLEGLLDRAAGTKHEDDESLRIRLADRVRELEVSHPDLSATVGRVIDTLAFFNL